MAETEVVLCLSWVLELIWHEARLFEDPLLPGDISPSHQVQQKTLVESSIHLRMSSAETQEVGLFCCCTLSMEQHSSQSQVDNYSRRARKPVLSSDLEIRVVRSS